MRGAGVLTARDLLTELHAVKPSGEGWVSRCPGPHHDHGDRKRSLSIKEQDGKVLLHCFVGCTAEEIAKALGHTLADLFVEPRQAKEPARIVAAYDYTDLAGTLLYQNVRYDPKDFRQRRPKPDAPGDWLWTMGSVPRVLYRLLELAGHKRIYLVEGEKDTDNLRAAGAPATTHAGGAKSWRDEYAAQLQAAGVEEVIILPDNDDPGRAWAKQAAAAITAIGLTARTLLLPGLLPKGDVSDWLQAGHQVVELEALVAALIEASAPQPLPVHTWAQLIKREREKLVYLWPGWVVEKKIILVAGAGDSMKSFLCSFLGTMVASGKPALEPDSNDNPCAQGPVLIVSAENGLDEDTRRFQLLHRGHKLPDDLPVTLLSADSLSLRDDATWVAFEALVVAVKPRLVVIDSAVSVADLENENDNARVTAFMKKCIQPLARVHGATVLLIVHSPKPPTQRGSLPFTDEHVARGASAFRNASDGVLYLKRDKSLGKDAVVLRPAKVRSGYRHPPIWFRIENSETDDGGQSIAVQVRYGGEFTEETGQASEAAAALDKAIQAAISVLKASPGSRISKLVEGMAAGGISEATARRAIAVMRGQKEWPTGAYVGKKQAVVDEAPGPRNMVFLTFNSSGDAALSAPPTEDDDVPF